MPSLISYIGKIFEAPGSASAKKTGELITKKGKVKPKVVVYTDNLGGTAAFEEPDYDWEQIQKAMNADAWLNQAYLKYRELMWKEGTYLKGSDPNAVSYIKKRFQILSLAQGRSMDDLLIDAGDSLVRYANAFIVKARDDKPYQLSGLKVQAAIGNKPVGGYFIAPVETMQIKVDKNGTVQKYLQDINGLRTEFNPEDVIHITYDRPPGTQWGHPWILSVLEDLRSLRLMEEDMLNVYHKEVSPVYKYKLGGPDGRFLIEQEDIDAAETQVKNMHDVGAIILPGTDDIDVIGSEGKALDIQPYISHWRDRVISGFGLSAHHLGISSNVNSSSASSMDSALYDKLKSYQSVLENAICLEIIFELLLEGGFSPFNPSGDDQMVYFEFKEIDLENRVKLENHISVLWLQNMITHGQMREALGEEVDPQYKDMYHIDMIEIPLAEVSKAITGPEGGSNPNSPAKGTAGSKNNPSNQKGNRGAPKMKAASYDYNALISNILNEKDENIKQQLIEKLYLELLFVKEKTKADIFYKELQSLLLLDSISTETEKYIKEKLNDLLVDVTI